MRRPAQAAGPAFVCPIQAGEHGDAAGVRACCAPRGHAENPHPIDGVARLHKQKQTPTSLTALEVNAICAVVKAWERTRGTCGPNPDGQLGQIVEVRLGTPARIGELLARGGTCRQPHPKTDRSNRVVALPTFTAEAIRRRLSVVADRSPDALVFQSREARR